MSNQATCFYITPWKKYVVLFSISLFSAYCLYEIKQFHDAGNLYFYHPFVIFLVFASFVGTHVYLLNYCLEGKTLIVEGLVNRKVVIDKLKYVSVRKKSVELVNRYGLFSLPLRSIIEDLEKLTDLIDQVMVDHPEVKLKGQSEYCRKWFPKTVDARKGNMLSNQQT